MAGQPAGPTMNRVIHPEPSSPAVSQRMSEVKTRDTAIELELRSQLHRRGLRFRVDHQVSGVSRARPDVVFSSERVAVFVDGCFWHYCPEHRSLPVANGRWWEAKFEATVERDRRHEQELTEAGWLVIRIWGHEDPAVSSASIAAAVRERRHAG